MQYLLLSEGSRFNSGKQGPSSDPLSIPAAPAALVQVIPRSEKPGLGGASPTERLTWLPLVISPHPQPPVPKGLCVGSVEASSEKDKDECAC